MSFKQFFKITVESFKPHRYKGLTQRTLTKSIFFFFVITFIYMILISGINTTRYITNLESNISGFSKLEKFDLTLNIKTEKPVIISNYPLIIIDSENNQSKLEKEDMLITGTKFTKKIFLWDKSIVINEINLKDIIDKTIENKLLLILLVPFALIFIFVYLLMKYLIIAIILAMAGTVFLMFGENNSKITEIIKAAIYAIIIYYLGNLISSFIHINYIGLIAYVIFFIIVLFLLKEDTRSNFDENSIQDEEDGGF